MARKYTTKAKVENYLLVDIDSSFNSQVDEWIESVSAEIERITSRIFIADDIATARLFDGNGDRELQIDDAVAVTIVERGADTYGDSFTTIPSSGSGSYLTLPNNSAGDDTPIQSLFLRDGYWTSGLRNHRITAKWGYSVAVPKDIELAATIMVAGVINATRKDLGEIKSEKIGNYSVTYKDDKGWDDYMNAEAIIDRYKRYFL